MCVCTAKSGGPFVQLRMQARLSHLRQPMQKIQRKRKAILLSPVTLSRSVPLVTSPLEEGRRYRADVIRPFPFPAHPFFYLISRKFVCKVGESCLRKGERGVEVDFVFLRGCYSRKVSGFSSNCHLSSNRFLVKKSHSLGQLSKILCGAPIPNLDHRQSS